ncbi:MAG: translational machinery protein [Devosia sp.]
MAHKYHAIVWIDHREARVFNFDSGDAELMVIRPENPAHHIHHKANSTGSGHAAEDEAFLDEVAAAIAEAETVLITGPANEKTELAKRIQLRHPLLAQHIAAVETVDHPSDGALVAHARAYFKTDHQTAAREN